MSSPSLTTLANVKSYLGITASSQDSLITALIARESALISQWTGRSFSPATFTDRLLSGTGSSILALPDGPVLTVTDVNISGVDIPLALINKDSGFTYDDASVILVPAGFGVFPRGNKNVMVSWTTGYKSSETGYTSNGQANSPVVYTPTTDGRAMQSISVNYDANGVALTEVGSSPSAGQFTFSDGLYTFNAADASVKLDFSYYFVPAPVEQACIEMVGLDLKQRDNLGVNSKTLAGETVAYTTKGMTDSVKEMLAPYKQMWRPAA